MRKILPRHKTTIIGRSGCGKSYLGREIQSLYPKIIVFDSLYEYPEHPTDINSFDQFVDFIEHEQQKYRKFFRVVRVESFDENSLLVFDQMIRLIYEVGDMCIVIEEVQDYATPYFIGKYFRKALTSGRHRGLSMIFTTQRPALVNKTILSQSNHIFVGNLIDINDSRTMGNIMRIDKDAFNNLEDCNFFWFTPHHTPHTIKINTRNKQDMSFLD